MNLLFTRKHITKLMILLLLVFIILIREISVYWLNLSEQYKIINRKLQDSSFFQEIRSNEKAKTANLDEILNSIWTVSDEQMLIERVTILQTLRFMVEERSETDPELVAFVRSLIIPPPSHGSGRKLKLKNKNKLNSSHTESSKFIDQLLKEKTGGFFIEAGAHDGEDISNTLFFELERGWTGNLKAF